MQIAIIKAYIWPSIAFLLLFTLLLGFAYPGIITLLLQSAFHQKANGSLIFLNETCIGSSLIGQPFSDKTYFWGRPLSTGASHLSINNPILLERVQKRAGELAQYHDKTQPIPVDLVTLSASGIDPHISLASALYQVQRVSRARQLSEQTITNLVFSAAENGILSLLSEPHVNVLQLNLKLDEIAKTTHGS